MQSDSSDEEPEQLQCKVILLGDGAVGKTSVALRLTEDHFATQYKQTIGLDFFMKRLVLPGSLRGTAFVASVLRLMSPYAGDIHVAMQVWDIGGQSIGSKMISNYIYGAQVVLLLYDITDYQTFQNLEDWYRLVRRTYGHKALPYVALVGNKSATGSVDCIVLHMICGCLCFAADLNHMRNVKLEKHNGFADENDMYSYFVSAKTGDNVNAAFHRIAAEWAGVVMTKTELEVCRPVCTPCMAHVTVRMQLAR